MAVTDFNGRNIWGPTDGAPVTTYHIDSDRRDIDVSKEISYLVPEATPFLTILLRARRNPVHSLEAHWYDKGAPQYYTQINNGGGYASGATELILDDSGFIRVKDILKVTRTGELLYVSDNDTDTDTVTVTREYGYDSDASTGTEAAAINDDDYIMRVGNAMEENSSAPSTYATQPTKLWNYVQTIRTPFDGSNDNEAEGKKAGPATRIRLRRENMLEHRLDVEKTALFSERMEHVTASRRLTGGVVQYIKTNSYDVSTENDGILTEAELDNICETAFKYKSQYGSNKLLVTSHWLAGIINRFAADRITTTSGDETYGLKLKKYQSFHGDLILAPTRMFEHDYQGVGLILDMANIAYRPYDGKDATLRTNIQDNDVDGWEDEYMTKFMMEVRNEETHAIFTGVSS